ncbi:cold-shock protein [Streptomyces sp. ISL-100]|uniref:cold-shock protein n=1 Tax=Streptomyces sp. ISL-100 TaxID=2819173 RepID=UPI001BECAB66|nr:cold-shock protein [Streptomyces sp. ISL-100]MBT2400085.1 cold-shock protein [Streptomyces sp. ISL-100]
MEDGDRGLKASSVRLAEGADGTPLTPPRPAPAASAAAVPRQVDSDDSLCDVLGAAEFIGEVTEVLLQAAPSLTGEQILQIRGGLAGFAKSRGWTES